MTPAFSSAAKNGSPSASNASSASAPLRATTSALNPSPKRTTSPARRRFAGRTKARQTLPPISLCKVASMATGSPPSRFSRAPNNCAGMTLVSLATRRSPGRRSESRSLTIRSSSPASFTQSRRAESRGLAGVRAIRSCGSSKSKRSTRMGGRHAAPRRETQSAAISKERRRAA